MFTSADRRTVNLCSALAVTTSDGRVPLKWIGLAARKSAGAGNPKWRS